MRNRLFSSESFKDALQEHLVEIVVPFQKRLHVARRRARVLRPLIEWIVKTQLLRSEALLGPILRSEPYPVGERDGSPGMLFQGAIMLPHGLGILYWDAEELMSLPSHGLTVEEAAWLSYLPFERCSPAHQALLADAIVELAEQLLKRLRSELSDPLDLSDGG